MNCQQFLIILFFFCFWNLRTHLKRYSVYLFDFLNQNQGQAEIVGSRDRPSGHDIASTREKGFVSILSKIMKAFATFFIHSTF